MGQTQSNNMNNFEFDEDKSGQENEEDLKNLLKKSFSEAVVWSTDWTTETILSQLNKGNIELSPSFQRRDAWGIDRKSKFIESIILGLPIPQIILAERKEKKGTYIVIDGKQRLLSIRQFYAQEDDKVFTPLAIKGLPILTDLNGKKMNEIKENPDLADYISAFENQSIRTIIIRSWPDQSFLYTVFLRLNTGSLPLSPQELRQALQPGFFTTFADEFSVTSEQIKKALGLEKPDYRMRDVEVVVRYFAFINFIEDYNGNLKDFFDNTCERFNKEWPEKKDEILSQSNELNNAIDFVFEIFEENAFNKYYNGKYTGIFNRSVFDIMTYYFYKPEIRLAARDKKEAILKLFESLCTNDVNFLRSLETSTKNIEPTAYRYKVWGTKLKEILAIEIRVPQRADSGFGIKVL
jgi:hypothetical protein